jgi:uncharacterized protein YkwD
MRRRVHKKTSNNRFFIVYVFLAIICLGLVSFGTRVLFPKPVTLKPLAKLYIPKEPTIYLPGPYEAATIESGVLGADTIDPRDIITYVNHERMNRGIAPLRVNKTLALAAQMRADVILRHQNFAHQDPYEHIQLDTVLPIVNYPFVYASENIGMGDNSGRAFVNGFMNSPSHKANLHNPELQETGVAIVTGPYRQYYVNIAVQLFAIPTTQDKYLGYRKEDIQEYKKLLADIESELAVVNERLQNKVGDQEYYEGWQKLLIRQREIVTILYGTMLENQPFVKNLVSLMGEYNNNWNLIPKTKS